MSGGVGQLGGIVRDLQRLFLQGTTAGFSEGQLLERFARSADAHALEALIQRHGPMVLGVCRQWLDDPNDIDDAFQATFLVLIRRCDSLRRQDYLGSWLYGVALRVARRARGDALKRRLREASLEGTLDGVGKEIEPSSQAEGVELRRALHDEVARLPETYRQAVVVCFLEGQSHEDAARALGWPVGTVKGRLSRAKEMLRERLKRRGFTTTSAGILATLSATAEAAAPAHLVASTTSAAMSAIAPLLNGTVLAVTISTGAIALTEGVLKAMSIAQLKVLGASVAIAMGLLATGAEVVRAYQAPAGPSGAAQAKAAAAASATPAVPSSAPGGIGSTGPRAERSAAPAVGSGAGMMPGGLGAAPGAGMGPADARLDLAQQQVELARRGLAQVERLIQAGEAGPAELQHWAKRLLDARLALHPTGDESIAALKDYVEQARRWVQVLQNLQKVGQKSNLDVIDAEFDLLNARLELEKRIKPAASGLPGMGMFPPGAAPPAVSAGAGMGMLPPKPEQPEGFKGGGLAPPVTYARVPAQGGVIPPEPTLVVPAGMPEGGVGGGGFGGRGRSAVKFRKPNPLDEPRNKAIEEKLEMVIDLRFKVETPLEDFLGYIKDQTKGKDGKEIPVYVDPKGLQEAECTMTSPVMIELEGVPLRTTLRLVLEQVGLRYEVADGILLITNEQPEE